MGVTYYFRINDPGENGGGNSVKVLGIYYDERKGQATSWSFGDIHFKAGHKPSLTIQATGDKCVFNGKQYIFSTRNSYGTYDYYGSLQSGKQVFKYHNQERTRYFNKFNTEQVATFVVP